MSKKQLIMDKSLELFAKKGFKATSIQEITNACGISKGAFYLSFKSKDELILALTDHFMEKFVSDIDQLVRESDYKKVFYNYYYYNFSNLSKKSAFAELFMKEQMHFIDKAFITKLYEYMELIQQSMLVMIEKAYGDKVKEIKYDLVYTIQGLVNAYTELFLFNNIHSNIDLLAKSLAEKTDLLANSLTTPYIKEDVYYLMRQTQKDYFSEDAILGVIDEALSAIEESIEKDSLLLLKQELIQPTMNEAVIKGLLENIKHHPACHWAGYVLRNYFNVE